MDFVFPNGNEEEFVRMAKKLGYDSLCFVYNMKNFKKFDSKEIKVYTAILEDRNFDRAKQMANFVIAKADDSVRGIIEARKAKFIFGFEENGRRDFTHYRNSGLNQVLCKLMNEKEIGYFVSVKELIEADDPQFIGRVMQNIRFCEKFKVKVAFGSFATTLFEMKGANDVLSLRKVLGAQ